MALKWLPFLLTNFEVNLDACCKSLDSHSRVGIPAGRVLESVVNPTLFKWNQIRIWEIVDVIDPPPCLVVDVSFCSPQMDFGCLKFMHACIRYLKFWHYSYAYNFKIIFISPSFRFPLKDKSHVNLQWKAWALVTNPSGTRYHGNFVNSFGKQIFPVFLVLE